MTSVNFFMGEQTKTNIFIKYNKITTRRDIKKIYKNKDFWLAGNSASYFFFDIGNQTMKLYNLTSNTI